MPVKTTELSVSSSGNLHAIDLTERAERFLTDSGMSEGLLTVFSPETVCGVVVMEFEPGLLEDLAHLFERVASARDAYRHNQRRRMLDGHAHMRALLSGSAATIPFTGGRLCTSDAQQVFLIDYGPSAARRRVVLQAVGQ